MKIKNVVVRIFNLYHSRLILSKNIFNKEKVLVKINWYDTVVLKILS